MATHPVEHDTAGPGEEPVPDAQPNTTRLPVEPEFVPPLNPPADPDDPHTRNNPAPR